jgi:hypothetical protein
VLSVVTIFLICEDLCGSVGKLFPSVSSVNYGVVDPIAGIAQSIADLAVAEKPKTG